MISHACTTLGDWLVVDLGLAHQIIASWSAILKCKLAKSYWLIITLLQAGGKVVEAACIIEMPDLKGREKLGGIPLYAQIEKEGG